MDSKKIVYRGWGKDFTAPPDSNLPRVCFGLANDTDDPAPERLGRRLFVVRYAAEDGWYDIWVNEMTDKTIKSAIAHVNGVSPENIEII